jgi:hypothetical protein
MQLPILLSLVASVGLLLGPIGVGVCPQQLALGQAQATTATASCCCGPAAGRCCAVSRCRPLTSGDEPALPTAAPRSDLGGKHVDVTVLSASLQTAPAMLGVHDEGPVRDLTDLHPSLLRLSIRLNI